MSRAGLLLFLLLSACVKADDDAAAAAGSGGASGSSAESSSSSGGHNAGELPPTDGALLVSWLTDGSYLGWRSEAAIHPSLGPHLGAVRTFVNAALAGSLQSGAEAHDAGAAAVKELYGSGTTLLGWAVSVKTSSDSEAGNAWYWYEQFSGSGVLADGLGSPVCTGCHIGGTDFVLSESF
jgi:hypothetical protein